MYKTAFSMNNIVLENGYSQWTEVRGDLCQMGFIVLVNVLLFFSAQLFNRFKSDLNIPKKCFCVCFGLQNSWNK